jgi:hypothetical protein
MLSLFSRLHLFLIVCITCVTSVWAADDNKTTEPPANKLTFGYYNFSSGKNGEDLNLRHSFKSSTAWIGGYHESAGFNQVRIGYEYDYRHNWVTFIPTALAASHGFVGTSVYSEVGHTFFGIGGFGATNLKPYWNLGFDPNDYIQFGLGFRDHAGNTISAYAIRDDRLGTGQTNTHLIFRRYLPHEWRLTADVLHESGHADDGSFIRAWAPSVDVDWRRWFVRVARDPHVNYTADRQVRVSGGLRF